MPYDVAIVGLGTAGSALAFQCARVGLRVLGVDARAFDEAGARWVNGVPAWTFDAASIARPSGEERCAIGLDFHMVAGWGPSRTIVRAHDLVEVDMRHLQRRLRDEARARGAELREGVEVHDAETLDATYVVDAAGLAGPNLLGRPPLDPEELCVAAWEERRVDDLPAASAFFRGHGVEPGATLCFTSIAGGFSILNLRLHGDAIAVLAGSIPGLGHPSGPELLKDFVAEHDWVGARVFGGSRALPLAPPPVELVRGKVATIGDTARQIHAAHGSGVGQQLLAGRLLAEAIADDDLAEYEHRWLRDYGGLLSGMSLFARFSTTLAPEDLERLMAAGALPEGITRRILTQRLPLLGPLELARATAGLAREPDLARRLLPVVAKIVALEAHHRRVPRHDRGAWEQRRERLQVL